MDVFAGVLPVAGGDIPPRNVANLTDTSTVSLSVIDAGVLGGGTWHGHWTLDLGAAVDVDAISVGGDGDPVSLESSSDGILWTEVLAAFPADNTTRSLTANNHNRRYWRLVYTVTLGGLAFFAGAEIAYLRATVSAFSPPVADFDTNNASGFVPLAVSFIDLSLNTPSGWHWDFGDGRTSAVQSPTHLYAAPGFYTVSLTATNSHGSDTTTRVDIVSVLVVVPPSGATIEIFATDPGSYRWDIAHWDVATWGASSWQDVTPESVSASVQWGTTQAELGILSVTDAGNWNIQTFDPDRILDPGNPDSPFAAQLVPGLPIRLLHRNIVVRTGIADVISYSMADKGGQIRCSDNISLLARSTVPKDSTLMPNTLRARARRAILVAGADVRVEPNPPGADPVLAAWIPAEENAWQTIQEAAQQVLHVPFIDRVGILRFRPYRSPLKRGLEFASPELTDIITIQQVSGLFSVVRAQQTAADGGLVIERRVVPTPRYGERVTQRTDPTPKAAAWAEAVLLDRQSQTVRSAGTVRPLDAKSLETLALVQTGEFVQMVDVEATPPIQSGASVLGGTINVVARVNKEASWTFEFEVTKASDEPLSVDGAFPVVFIEPDGSDGFLYLG
jgi:PKD repeat protein